MSTQMIEHLTEALNNPKKRTANKIHMFAEAQDQLNRAIQAGDMEKKIEAHKQHLAMLNQDAKPTKH